MKRVILFRGNAYQSEEEKVYLIPLSLLSLAASLHEPPVILDGNVHSETECCRLIDGDILCVGISALTGPEVASGLRFAKLIRERHPEVPIIWGGWHVSCLPQQSIKNPYVDAVVVGLGQEMLSVMVSGLKEGRNLQGIHYASHFDLANFPLPAFHLIDMEFYRRESLLLLPYPEIDGQKLTGYLYYVTSFGCPHACGFCSNNTLFHHRWAGYAIDKVVQQLNWLADEKGFNCVALNDAEFFHRVDRVEYFCDHVQGFVWDAQASVKSILYLESKDLLSKIRKSGCWHMNVGIESGSAELLKYMNKGISTDDILRVASALKNNGIVGCYNFLFALPAEQEASLNDSFDLAYRLKEINADSPLPVSFYSPLPDNPIFQDSIQRGFQSPQSLEEWGNYNPSYGRLNPALPWGQRRREKLIYNVMTFYLPMAVPGNLMRGTITSFKQKVERSAILRLISKVARFRMDQRWFSFPFERLFFDLHCWLMHKTSYVSGRWKL